MNFLFFLHLFLSCSRFFFHFRFGIWIWTTEKCKNEITEGKRRKDKNQNQIYNGLVKYFIISIYAHCAFNIILIYFLFLNLVLLLRLCLIEHRITNWGDWYLMVSDIGIWMGALLKKERRKIQNKTKKKIPIHSFVCIYVCRCLFITFHQ